METFESPAVDNVVLVTAAINIVAFFLLWFTCRFIPGFKLTQPLMDKSWFKRLYRYHSYVWWVFVPSVMIHAILAILHRLAGG